MAHSIRKLTTVNGIEEVEQTMVKKRGWFLIFPTEWWEVEGQTHIGNDIYITSDRQIRKVVLNGEEYTKK